MLLEQVRFLWCVRVLLKDAIFHTTIMKCIQGSGACGEVTDHECQATGQPSGTLLDPKMRVVKALLSELRQGAKLLWVAPAVIGYRTAYAPTTALPAGMLLAPVPSPCIDPHCSLPLIPSRSTFCWDGHVFKCANGGFRCEDGAGRCVSKSTYPHLPGRWTRYSCLNNK